MHNLNDFRHATVFLLGKRPQETAATAYAETDSGDDDADGDHHQTVSTHRFLVFIQADF